jgi:hypothetical protein
MAISDDGMFSSESVGFGSQIGDSIKGILAGIVLFPLSFYAIFKVETCNQAGDAFKKAKPISQKEEGKPIYVTGNLSADPLGSQFLKAGSYLSIAESSEVYAWDEEERTEGSGNNKKKIKECKLEWTSNPRNPSSFTLPNCKKKVHYKRKVESSTVHAQNGQISADGQKYSINLQEVSFASSVTGTDPSSEDYILGSYKPAGKYLYNDPNCDSSPREGCERVSVRATPIPSSEMTFLGDVNGNKIVKYIYKDDQFLNASIGNYQQTMANIKSDDATMKWVGRGIAFAMMWASFVLMAGPLMTLLEFIPFVGEFGKGALNFVFGAIAFVITAITVILVKFWYIWLLLLLGAIGYAIYKRKFAAKAA